MLVSLFLTAYVVSANRLTQAHVLESESIPAVVSDAIRKAKSNAQKVLETAKSHEAIVNERKTTATETAAQKAAAEKEKESAAKEAIQKAKEAADQAKVAAEAARSAIASKGDWAAAVEASQKAQDEYQKALEKYNEKTEHVQGEIRRLKKELADVEAIMNEAAAAAECTARSAEELRIAYEAAKEADETQVKELKEAQGNLAEANTKMEQKSLSARVAGREAEAAQIALEDAISEWNAAKEDVERKRRLKDLLWDLYDAIEDFYRASSDLTRAMRRSECTDAPHECLVSGEAGGGRAKLMDVLVNYNSMVLSFMKIKELYPNTFEEIKEAQPEIESNAMSQVKLSCDPDMKLEEAGDANDFNAKCGDGLWPALGLNKNRFF